MVGMTKEQEQATTSMVVAILESHAALCEQEARISRTEGHLPCMQAGIVQGLRLHMMDVAKFLAESADMPEMIR